MSGRKIFVCYRREDSAGHAGRLYDRLNLRFPGRVFMDVAAIGLGTRWAEVIEQTLASCEVVLLLIGRRWLERQPDGTRRIDDLDDPLRAEITTSLKLHRRIVPVLVGGAAMPDASALPADVAPVAAWQAVHVADDDFDHDAQRLIRAIEGYMQEPSTDPHLEQQAARRAQIEALMADSATAVRAGAWVTAAQTLRSVLSLDPGNARAASELRDVEARWAEAYRQGQSRAVVMPRRGRWAAFGVVATLAVIGVVGLVLLVTVAFLLEAGSEPIVPFRAVEDQVPYEDSAIAAAPADAVTHTTSAQLVGQYVLAGYSQQGTRLPVVGRLTLVDGGGGQLRFEIQGANQVTGAAFWYRGVLQQHDAGWTMTTTESNDPTAGSYPIPTRLGFDGTVLTAANDLGEASVWHKQ